MGGLLKRAYPNATHQTLDVRGMWGNDPDQAGGRRYGALALVSHTHTCYMFSRSLPMLREVRAVRQPSGGCGDLQ